MVASTAKTTDTAVEVTRLALRELDMAASKGVIHKRNAARRKSRLMLQLNKTLAATPAPAKKAKA